MRAFPPPWTGVGLGTYQVWRDEPEYADPDPDTALAIEAGSPTEAAEKLARINDRESADYNIVRGDPALVCVRCPDGTMANFLVTGEPVPTYRATFGGLVMTQKPTGR
jgi:hypothetical protein